jgi:hypothetical protein
MLAFGASSAMAVPQLKAEGGIEAGGLRDDLTTPPTNAQYGADLLAQNTAAPLQLFKGGAAEEGLNKNGRWAAFVGIKLHSNPMAVNCSTATGYVEFADFQKAVTVPGGLNSPVYADTLIAPWRVDINSNSCEAAKNPNKVTVTGVGLYFPLLLGGQEVRGTITGKYEPPGGNCSAGGVNLDLQQPGLLANGAAIGAGINNGTAGVHAFLCFVSANNDVYPAVPVGEGAITGKIKNE